MASAGATADWFHEERRKQNAVIAAILLACLLVAFFPRNERRLFDFPGEAGMIASIGAPAQTRLRAPIYEPGPAQAPDRQDERIMPLPPLLDLDIDLFGDTTPPEWRIVNEPIRFDQPEMSGLAEITRRDWMADRPTFNAFNGGHPIFAGGVPEPETWALMILGVGAIAHRMRAERFRRRRRRGMARWRRNLVPRPIEAASTG